MSIPKIIHYCWFGPKEPSKAIQKCIDTWHEKLPEYEFYKWSEDNTSFDNAFVASCYKQKKWAFVSDYIRLKKLYDYGGIYLDTDMYLLKSLNKLLNQQCFFGSENEMYISCGIIGATKQHPFILKCLEKYQDLKIPKDNRWYKITIPQMITEQFKEIYSIQPNFNTLVIHENIVIYPKEYFYPYPNKKESIDIEEIKKYATEKTLAIHLWESSWMKPSEFELIKNRKYFTAMKTIILKTSFNKIFTKIYINKIVKHFKNSIKK